MILSDFLQIIIVDVIVDVVVTISIFLWFNSKLERLKRKLRKARME